MTADAVVTVRRARIEDLPALQVMQARAVRRRWAARYAPAAIDAALAVLLAGQMAPIAAGTSWLAEAACGSGADGGRLVASAACVPPEIGCAPAHALLIAPLDPVGPAAPEGAAAGGLIGRLCGLCVDPDFAGRGFARLMIAVAEAGMRRAGFGTAEVLAPPGTEALWLAAGFVGISEHALWLAAADLRLPVRRMVKRLPPAGDAAEEVEAKRSAA